MNKGLTVSLILACVLLITTVVWAQPLPPGMLKQSPQAAPIDGGLSIMIFAGGAYAFKKLHKK